MAEIISVFVIGHRETNKNLCRDGRSHCTSPNSLHYTVYEYKMKMSQLLSFTLWTGDCVRSTTFFTYILFLAVLLTNESVALIAFHRCWRIFLSPAYEAASPFLQWPTSDAISIIFHRKWTIFFKKCGKISRQWRYLRSWEEMLSLESTMDFSRKIFCFAVHRMVCWWCNHPRIDARNFHKDIKHSKWPGPCDTRDEIRCTHLVTCPRYRLLYYSPG